MSAWQNKTQILALARAKTKNEMHYQDIVNVRRMEDRMMY